MKIAILSARLVKKKLVAQSFSCSVPCGIAARFLLVRFRVLVQTLDFAFRFMLLEIRLVFVHAPHQRHREQRERGEEMEWQLKLKELSDFLAKREAKKA